MKNLFTLFILLSLITTIKTSAQAFYAEGDTVVNDSIIISEVMLGGGNQYAYYELTNMSSRTVNLEHYYFKNGELGRVFGYDSWRKPTMRSMLAPGKSFTWVVPVIDWRNDAEGKPLFPNRENVNIFTQAMADTSAINAFCTGNPKAILFQRFYSPSLEGLDSAMIDVFAMNPDFSNDLGPIAGKFTGHPAIDWVWVRKTSIKKGSLNWEAGRGTDLVDSEWIPLPNGLMRPRYALPYATFGRHGAGSPEGIISKGRVSIDHTNKTIDLPYGIRRDSLFREFIYNTDASWELKIGPDTTQYYVQTDDTVLFYFPGEDLNIVQYITKVEDRTEDFNSVRPVIYKNNSFNWASRYNLSYGHQPMDTIGGIAFATPIDTFFKYMLVEEGCMAKIGFTDGIERPEIINSDTLIVTSPNGAVKKYKFVVDKYFLNRTSSLKQVMFPGHLLWSNPNTFELTDTFLEFGSATKDYFIKLPSDYTAAPALIAQPSNSKSKVLINSAKNLFGSESDRTTTVTVYAEQDTLETIYKFVFVPQREEPDLDYSLFISEHGVRWGGDGPGSGSIQYQIFNPSNEMVDLTDYMFYQHGGSWDDLEAFLANPDNINKHNITFGYKTEIDPLTNEPILKVDNWQTTFSLEGKETYSLVGQNGFPYAGGGNASQQELVDYRIYRSGMNEAVGADPYGNDKSIFWAYPIWGNINKWGSHYMLLKMKPEKSDSLKDGLKRMNDLLNDWDVVDMVNGPASAGVRWEMYDTIGDWDSSIVLKNNADRDWCAHRRQWVYKGNPIDRLSFGMADEDGNTTKVTEWNWALSNYIMRTEGRALFDNHIMVVTEHLAYLTSSTMNVTEGITSPQTIYGATTALTVDDLLANLNKIAPENEVKVIDQGGLVKLGTDNIAEGDIVKSFSTRGLDSVVYNLILGELSNDINLTSNNNAYTVSIATDKKTGELSGVTFGISLSDLLDDLEVNALSRMIPTDSGSMELTLKVASQDTTDSSTGTIMDALVTGNTHITVIAQNGDICKYSLVFAKAANPYLVSEVYTVTEDSKSIDYVSSTSVRNLLAALSPAPGYQLKVVNKMQQERTVGEVKYDDMVVVFDPENPEVQVTYFLNFFDELKRDALKLRKTANNANVSVYPNPSSGSFNVVSDGAERILIHDISGKLIKTINTNSNHTVVDLGSKPNGIYFVTVVKNGLGETISISKM